MREKWPNRALDHGEEVDVELIPDQEVYQLIRDGRVDHALAVLSLYAWLFSEGVGR